MMNAIKLVEKEREGQLKEFDAKHDDSHTDGALWKAACAVLCNKQDVSFAYAVKPDDSDWIDILAKKHRDRIAALTIAGALIVAEIERVQRLRVQHGIKVS